MIEKLRIDKYLWAIRIFKTRSQATTAIDEGKVKWNGDNIKASKTVSIGEVYTIKTAARKWTIEVIGLSGNRMNYEESLKYYNDITPKEDILQNKIQVESFFTGKRMSKTGRPSKKTRRNLDDFFSEEVSKD